MIRIALSLIVALGLAACGAAGPPEPVTPGIETSGQGVSIDISGSASIGVVGGGY